MEKFLAHGEDFVLSTFEPTVTAHQRHPIPKRGGGIPVFLCQQTGCRDTASQLSPLDAMRSLAASSERSDLPQRGREVADWAVLTLLDGIALIDGKSGGEDRLNVALGHAGGLGTRMVIDDLCNRPARRFRKG